MKKTFLALPYKEKKGMNILKRYKQTLKPHLPNNVQSQVVYNSKKLSSNFNLKYKVEFKHKHDLVYKYECKYISCDATYTGETSRRISERMRNHIYCDKKFSYL